MSCGIVQVRKPRPWRRLAACRYSQTMLWIPYPLHQLLYYQDQLHARAEVAMQRVELCRKNLGVSPLPSRLLRRYSAAPLRKNRA